MSVFAFNLRTSMIDIQLLRKDIDSVAARLAARKFQLDVHAFNALEAERKAARDARYAARKARR